MAIELRHSRLIDFSGGFVADPDPNTTPPAEADIFKLAAQVSGSQLQTSGHVLQGEFDVEEASTFNFTTWLRNESTGKWMSLAPEIGAAHRALFGSLGTLAADVFVQVTAVSVTLAQALTVRIGETGS